MSKKVDFSKIVVRGIDGRPYEVKDDAGVRTPYDFAKTLG